MDYEKKYKESMKKFKNFKDKYCTKGDLGFGDIIFDKSGKAQEEFDSIFPELKESEDERMKNQIINYFECQSRDEPSRKDIHNKWINYIKRKTLSKNDYAFLRDCARILKTFGYCSHANKLFNLCPELGESIKEMMSTPIVSEESEDESIRKDLLSWLKSKDGQTLPIDKYNAAIAWLEKQSEDARNDSQIWQIANNSAKTWEQSFAILNAARKAYNKGKKDALKGQKPVEWKPIDTEYMDKLCEIIDEYDAETTTKCCWKNWLKSLKDRARKSKGRTDNEK